MLTECSLNASNPSCDNRQSRGVWLNGVTTKETTKATAKATTKATTKTAIKYAYVKIATCSIRANASSSSLPFNLTLAKTCSNEVQKVVQELISFKARLSSREAI